MKRAKQITALILAVAMSFSLLCSNVWASEIIIPDDAVTEETVEPIESETSVKETDTSETPVEENNTGETSVDSTDEVSIDTEESYNMGEVYTSEDWKYSLNYEGREDDDSIYIIEYTGTKTDVTIPATIDGKTVTRICNTRHIGSSVFGNCSSLVRVTIPFSLKSIGWNAFSGCSSLTSISIPSSVTTIDVDAFEGCSSLTSVTIPSSVTTIKSSAFSSCSGLKSITVNTNNTVYDSRNDCNAIIETKSNKLIHGCRNTSIPLDITSIGSYAFYGCSRLTNITIPSKVTSIGSCAFYGCSKLTSVEIPSKVTSIGNYAFNGCSKLTSVEIPSSVTSIGTYAFYGCSSLTSVTIPSSVTSIGDYAFYYCYGLTSVTIPSSVTSIGDYAFYYCYSLTSVTIPSSVTSIGDYAFYYCYGLTSVTIPSSVTSVGASAFCYCSSLKSVTIPSSVTSVGAYAFRWCSKLTDVYYEGSESDYEDKVDYDFDEGVTIYYNYHPADTSPISDCTVTLAEATYTYDGTAKKPAVTVKKGDATLVENTDYTVAYTNNINAGTATVTVTGKGNYSGSTEKTFTISKAEAGLEFESSSVSKKTSDDKFVNELTKKTDATVSYSSSDEKIATVASDGQVTIVGAGTTTITATASATDNYEAGTASYTLTVTKTIIPVSDCTVTLAEATYTYDGTAKKPAVTVKNGDATLVENTDYTVAYTNNINAGTATVTVTGKGNYSGSTEKTFTISKAEAGLEFESSSVSKKTSDDKFVNELTKKTDATVSYTSSDEKIATVASDGQVTIVGAGTTTITATASATDNYEAVTASYTLVVTKTIIPVSDCAITLEEATYTYDGTAKKPAVTVKNGDTKLVENTDYTVAYTNNINAGTATVTVTGKGNYSGSTEKTFTISKAEAGLEFESSSVSKKTSNDKFVNELTKRTDATVSYTSSDETVATIASDGQITIVGAGTTTITATASATDNYEAGTASYTLTVTKTIIPVSDCTVTLAEATYTYDGNAKKPAVTVKNGDATLVENTDYTVAYTNNINAGTATVTVTGKGNYSGSTEKTFTISKAEAGLEFESSSVSKKTSDDKFVNKLTQKTDAIVSYSSSDEKIATVASDGQVTIVGAGTTTITATASATDNYEAGTASYMLTVTKTIIPVSDCTVTLAEATYTYDGTEKKPAVTVKNGDTTLVKNTDYTVAYTNNVNAGTATVTVTGKGNYSGSTEKTFTISKAEAGLEFESSSVSKKTSDDKFVNELTKKTDAIVSYSSSDEKIATVASDGQVTIVGAGTTTITATASATDNYEAGTVSYTLMVKKKWDLSNQFSFGNTTSNFTTGKYTMLDSDFEKLSNYIKKMYDSASATSIINQIAQQREAEWGGSCFGMAMSSILDYTDQIAFNENFDSEATSIHDVASPSKNEKVQSAINYYFMGQLIGRMDDSYYNEFEGQYTQYNWDSWNKYLKQLVEQSKSDEPILFSYYFLDSEYEKKGHAIVVKSYDGIDNDGNYQLLAYDNRYPNKDATVLISSDYSKCTVRNIYADTYYIYTRKEPAIAVEYLSDFSAYDQIDIDGPNNDMIIDTSSNDAINTTSESLDGTELGIASDADVIIKNAKGEFIKIENGLISNDSTMSMSNVHMIVGATTDGTSSTPELMISVDNSSSYSFETTDGATIEASILNSSEYASVDADGADSITFSSSNGISITGDNVDCTVYQSVDEDDCSMFKFEGKTTGNANISYSNSSISVTGTVPGQVSITKYSDGKASKSATLSATSSTLDVSISGEPKEEHTHSYKSAVTIAPTCAKTGVKTYTCSCGASYTEDIPATGKHTVVQDKAVPATCTTAGKTAGSHCSVCGTGIVAQQTIPATGHTVVTDEAVAATCAKDGKTAGSHCSVCGTVIVAQQTIPATGNHTWNAVTDKKGVTCTCTICGTTRKITKTAVKYAVKLSATSFQYNGKVQKPVVTLQINGITVPTSEYTIKYSNKSSKKIGKYKVTIKAKKNSKWLSGSVKKTYKIVK